MQQTKPLFIIKKYRSLLRATTIVEAVCYIVSLTDSVVAGNAPGGEALAAIGLIAPFMSFSVFISGILSSGTVTKYSTTSAALIRGVRWSSSARASISPSSRARSTPAR